MANQGDRYHWSTEVQDSRHGLWHRVQVTAENGSVVFDVPPREWAEDPDNADLFALAIQGAANVARQQRRQP